MNFTPPYIYVGLAEDEVKTFAAQLVMEVCRQRIFWLSLHDALKEAATREEAMVVKFPRGVWICGNSIMGTSLSQPIECIQGDIFISDNQFHRYPLAATDKIVLI
jgi:hypothetical protein